VKGAQPSNKKRGLQHFKNQKHTFKRKGSKLNASDEKRGYDVSKIRNTTPKSEGT
jgi:hypothetical protein